MPFPAASTNQPRNAGSVASQPMYFGECSRFKLYAVHTRFDAVQWFVADAETADPKTGLASVVRQSATPEAAIAGLATHPA